MKTEKVTEVCTNISNIGGATFMASCAFGALWIAGSMIYDSIKDRIRAKKRAKMEAMRDEEWEAYKTELDEMIQKNEELLAKTEQAIEG